MKLLKYIFILLMLFAQQAIAYTADCQSKLDQCKANLIKYANWGDGAYGSCAFSLSVQPNGEGGNAFVGTFEGGYIVGGVKQPSNTSCWFNCPSGQAVNDKGDCTTCPSGQAASGQGCTFPPNPNPTPTANPNPTPTANPNPTQTCTAPKVFVSISGNCETPVVCTPPKVRSENANICTDPPDACAIAKDACFDAVRGHPEMSCFANGSPLRVCMKSSLVDTVRCTPCGDGDSYSADAEGNPLNPSTSPSTSSDAPGLETRKTDCEGKGGKWDYVFDSTVSSSDTYREYWKCEIAGAVTSYGGNGAIIPNKGSTQSPTQDQNLNCGGTTGITCESTQKSVDNSLKSLVVDFKGFSDTLKTFLSSSAATDKAAVSVDILTVPEWILIKDLFTKMKGNSKAQCKTEITGGCRPKVDFKTLHVDMKFEDLDTLFCDMAYVIRSILYVFSIISVLHFIILR